MSHHFLADLVVGICTYCKKQVTELESWGHEGEEMQGYPPRNPVYHTKCRLNAPVAESVKTGKITSLFGLIKTMTRVECSDDGVHWVQDSHQTTGCPHKLHRPVIDEILGWRTDRKSRAVVATSVSSAGAGVVVHWVGLISEEIDQIGSTRTEDLGLDDAPHGLSMWEGDLVTRPCGNPLDGYDVETELVGTFRPLTEWEALTVGRGQEPWDRDEWTVREITEPEEPEKP